MADAAKKPKHSRVTSKLAELKLVTKHQQRISNYSYPRNEENAAQSQSHSQSLAQRRVRGESGSSLGSSLDSVGSAPGLVEDRTDDEDESGQYVGSAEQIWDSFWQGKDEQGDQVPQQLPIRFHREPSLSTGRSSRRLSPSSPQQQLLDHGSKDVLLLPSPVSDPETPVSPTSSIGSSPTIRAGPASWPLPEQPLPGPGLKQSKSYSLFPRSATPSFVPSRTTSFSRPATPQGVASLASHPLHLKPLPELPVRPTTSRSSRPAPVSLHVSQQQQSGQQRLRNNSAPTSRLPSPAASPMSPGSPHGFARKSFSVTHLPVPLPPSAMLSLPSPPMTPAPTSPPPLSSMMRRSEPLVRTLPAHGPPTTAPPTRPLPPVPRPVTSSLSPSPSPPRMHKQSSFPGHDYLPERRPPPPPLQPPPSPPMQQLDNDYSPLQAPVNSVFEDDSDAEVPNRRGLHRLVPRLHKRIPSEPRRTLRTSKSDNLLGRMLNVARNIGN